MSEMRMSTVEESVAALASGGMIVVVDAPDRENEGDLVMAAEFATPDAVNFMATHGRGLICAPMRPERLAELRIPPMTSEMTDEHGTALHVGIDHASGGTGISAADRSATLRSLADPASQPSDFMRPGHVFPLAYRPGGVLRRAGHTEGSIDLLALAGLQQAAVICEIMDDDGAMARLPGLCEFAARHGLPIVAISDLIAYRRARTRLVRKVSEAQLPLEQGAFRAIAFEDLIDDRQHLALVLGDVAAAPSALVRMHSECLTGDVFGSRRCDCGRQLQLSLDLIAGEGAGAVVYLRGHEGRGIGLLEKIHAYRLQDDGLDTVEANLELGHPIDRRDYGVGMQILRELGVRRLRLLTNNPAKRAGLEGYGLSVVERIPLPTVPTPENAAYLTAKQQKLGHISPMLAPASHRCAE